MPVLVEFALSLAAIVVAASLFTNAVEILGGRLNLGEGPLGACSRPYAPPCLRP